jgi:dextranase
MKALRRSWLILAFTLSFYSGGGAVFAIETAVHIRLEKSLFHPSDLVQFSVTATSGNRAEARVFYLDQEVAFVAIPLADGRADITLTLPPTAPRGYGLVVEILDETGQALTTASSAFDVLHDWTDAPRYGFFSDFSAGRENDEVTMDWLLRHHINGVQFYDWQYRWENLVPEEDLFNDGLGRPQSMATVRRLIDLLHARNIAAMPYTAIYGASMAFFRQHPDWGLLDAAGDPYLFGDNLIGIMNPAPGSPWNQHLLAEFADVLDHTAFDGIHIDQYGSPKVGFDKDGNRVDLAEVMPQFIEQTADLVQRERGEGGVTLFNSVGNWPVETVALTRQDATYIEVWPPHDDYLDLNRIIVNAQKLGNEKQVILAAYIPPERTINWRLANAVIFASGGYHIETGEPETMLADPYFPRFGQIAEADQAVFGHYYDFLVRYENVLSIGTTAGATERAGAVNLGDIRTRGIRAKDRIVPIVRTGAGFETFSLISFVGIDEANWNVPATIAPTPFENLDIGIQVEHPVSRVWYASPDDPASMNAAPLPFTVENGDLLLRLPRLDYWSMIVVEYTDGN